MVLTVDIRCNFHLISCLFITTSVFEFLPGESSLFNSTHIPLPFIDVTRCMCRQSKLKRKTSTHIGGKKIVLTKWLHSHFCLLITVMCHPHHILPHISPVSFLPLIFHLSCCLLLRSSSLDICCNSHLISYLFICLLGCFHISLLSLLFLSECKLAFAISHQPSPNICLHIFAAPGSALFLPCHPPLPLISWYLL